MSATKTPLDRAREIVAAASAASEAAAKPVFETKAIKCGRCKGNGFIAFYAYKDNGRCMGCSGSGLKVVAKSPAAEKAAVKAAHLAEISILGKGLSEAIEVLGDADGLWANRARASWAARRDDLRASFSAAAAKD